MLIWTHGSHYCWLELPALPAGGEWVHLSSLQCCWINNSQSSRHSWQCKDVYLLLWQNNLVNHIHLFSPLPILRLFCDINSIRIPVVNWLSFCLSPKANEWNKNDERLLAAVEHGEVEKVASLLSKKGASAGKLDNEGKSAWVLIKWSARPLSCPCLGLD